MRKAGTEYVLLDACKLALALFAENHALSRFDWGNAAFRVRDIQELNEAHLLLHRAIKDFENEEEHE